MNPARGVPNHEAEVRAVVERWAAAVRNRDLAGILLDHSPDILMFDLPPPLLSKGIDEYKRTWDLFFSWSREPVVFDIQELSVAASDGVAFAAALMRCAGGADHAELQFRLTMGLVKVNGRWVVQHEHHSVPATT